MKILAFFFTLIYTNQQAPIPYILKTCPLWQASYGSPFSHFVHVWYHCAHILSSMLKLRPPEIYQVCSMLIKEGKARKYVWYMWMCQGKKGYLQKWVWQCTNLFFSWLLSIYTTTFPYLTLWKLWKYMCFVNVATVINTNWKHKGRHISLAYPCFNILESMDYTYSD